MGATVRSEGCRDRAAKSRSPEPDKDFAETKRVKFMIPGVYCNNCICISDMHISRLGETLNCEAGAWDERWQFPR